MTFEPLIRTDLEHVVYKLFVQPNPFFAEECERMARERSAMLAAMTPFRRYLFLARENLYVRWRRLAYPWECRARRVAFAWNALLHGHDCPRDW